MSILPTSSLARPNVQVDRPNSVYRYYDHAGRLIYVGITARGIQRQHEHNAFSEWWPLVARQEVEHLASRQEALDRERELIQSCRPPFNRTHNEQWRDCRDAYLRLRKAEQAYEATRLGDPIPPGCDGTLNYLLSALVLKPTASDQTRESVHSIIDAAAALADRFEATSIRSAAAGMIRDLAVPSKAQMAEARAAWARVGA